MDWKDPIFPLGKLPHYYLERMLRKYSVIDGTVVVGPGIGEDAAVVDVGDRYLVLKTDPITFVVEDIGWYAIQINANDLATRGARPRWFLSTLLLPEGKASAEVVEGIFAQIGEACQSLGISWVGGHTEITYKLDRPIVVGCMVGEADKDKLITTAGARVGDDIVLSKGIAIEGTSIIARELADQLRERGYDQEFLARCRNFLYDPGIGILREAMVAVAAASIHAMHDPTEGGLVNGLFELAQAAQVGILLELDSIPIYPETRALCRELALDPLGLIASGSLLLVLPPEETPCLLEKLRQEGIEAARIGKVLPGREGMKAREGGRAKDLSFFERDEITRIFEQ
jgi:hydrogenase maturation factor